MLQYLITFRYSSIWPVVSGCTLAYFEFETLQVGLQVLLLSIEVGSPALGREESEPGGANPQVSVGWVEIE